MIYYFRVIGILGYLCLFSISSHGDSIDIFKELYSGENIGVQYHGPKVPIFLEVPGRFLFLDKEKIYRDEILLKNLDPDNQILDLNRFLEFEFFDNLRCPELDFMKNADYISYLFRLITLNYLYEYLHKIHEIGYEFGHDKSICSLNWKKKVETCQPKSKDMKLYRGRVLGEIEKNGIKFDYKFSPPTKIKELYKNILFNFDPVIRNVIANNCVNCEKISSKDFKSFLKNECTENQAWFNQICSEEDQIYGVSKSKILMDALSQTTIFKTVEKSGNKCIGRFVDVFKSKEFYTTKFLSVLDAIHSSIKLTNSTSGKNNKFGRFFVQGVMKEFDEKGLKDFLFKPEIKKVVIKKKITKKTPVKKITTEEIIKPIQKVKVVKVDKPQEVKTLPSVFESAYSTLKSSHLTNVSLDLYEFKKEKRFTQEDINFLRDAVGDLITQPSLKKMREINSLGSQKVPVKLSLIKYLIDESNHQGLYNILRILGSKFYVYNDLEKKKDVVLFGMTNNKTTRYQWVFKIYSEK